MEKENNNVALFYFNKNGKSVLFFFCLVELEIVFKLSWHVCDKDKFEQEKLRHKLSDEIFNIF